MERGESRAVIGCDTGLGLDVEAKVTEGFESLEARCPLVFCIGFLAGAVGQPGVVVGSCEAQVRVLGLAVRTCRLLVVLLVAEGCNL